MNYAQAIQILRNERACVNRDGCDRECCARCDLAMEKADILAALDLAVECVKKRDVEQVVHAYWEIDTYPPKLGSDSYDVSAHCSNCGCKQSMPFYERMGTKKDADGHEFPVVYGGFFVNYRRHEEIAKSIVVEGARSRLQNSAFRYCPNCGAKMDKEEGYNATD